MTIFFYIVYLQYKVNAPQIHARTLVNVQSCLMTTNVLATLVSTERAAIVS